MLQSVRYYWLHYTDYCHHTYMYTNGWPFVSKLSIDLSQKYNSIVIKVNSICATFNSICLLRLNLLIYLVRVSNLVDSLTPTIATHMLLDHTHWTSQQSIPCACHGFYSSWPCLVLFDFFCQILVSLVTVWSNEWSRCVCRPAWLGMPCWMHYYACPMDVFKWHMGDYG